MKQSYSLLSDRKIVRHNYRLMIHWAELSFGFLSRVIHHVYLGDKGSPFGVVAWYFTKAGKMSMSSRTLVCPSLELYCVRSNAMKRSELVVKTINKKINSGCPRFQCKATNFMENEEVMLLL